MNAKEITQDIDRASQNFDAFLSEAEKQMFDKAMTEAKTLATDKKGNIVFTMDNLTKVNRIINALKKVSDSPEYLAGVRDLVKTFNDIEKAGSYWVAKEFKDYDTEAVKKKTEALKIATVNNTIEGLTGANINAYVMEPLRKTLMTAVTTGTKYSDLTKQLQQQLISSPDGTSALAKYAGTYATTAMTQYAGQQNKVFTDDLDVQWFRYVGSTIETTREFCELLTQKEYIHRSEIPTILKGEIEIGGEIKHCKMNPKTGLPQGLLPGTNAKNFQVNVGGWNCRHQLLPISEASVPANIREKFEGKTEYAKWLKEDGGAGALQIAEEHKLQYGDKIDISGLYDTSKTRDELNDIYNKMVKQIIKLQKAQSAPSKPKAAPKPAPSKPKAISEPTSTPVGLSTKKQEKHPKEAERDLDSRAAAVRKQTGATVNESREYASSIWSFTGNGYTDIRRYQRGDVKGFDDILKHILGKQASSIEEFLKRSPQWAGGTTYRGQSMTESEYRRMMRDLQAEKYEMGGSASWSTDKDISESFAYDNLGGSKKVPVVFICRNGHGKGATSIRYISKVPREDEVLASKDNRYKLIKAEEENGTRFIYVESSI